MDTDANMDEESMNMANCDIDMSDLLQEITGMDYMTLDGNPKKSWKEPPKFQNDLSEREIYIFPREASKAFFDEWGLVSHQLNSFNEFIKNGLQKLFDDFGSFDIDPDFNPKNRAPDSAWRHASVSFGKVTVEKPMYYTKDGQRRILKPAEARLRNMTYSSPIYVDMKLTSFQTHLRDTFKFESKSKSGVFSKGGKSNHDIKDERRVLIGRIPVMVKSELCHLHGLDADSLCKEHDCAFDVGGYFIIKGHEKVFIAQEERCTNRIWVQSKPSWMAIYSPSTKSPMAGRWEKVLVKFGSKAKDKRSSQDKESGFLCGYEKPEILVSFFVITVPIVLLFYALGVSSDLEMVQMIGCLHNDQEMCEYVLTFLYKAESELKYFRNKGEVWRYLEEKLKNTKFPSSLSVEELLNRHLFPLINGHKQKAMFLGYMLNCLLSCYLGRRKLENKDDFRNKRLDLAGELLTRQMLASLNLFRRRMSLLIQKDISGERALQGLEYYTDASILTNGLVRGLSTGNWPHPTNMQARCTGVVSNVKQINPLQILSEMRRLQLWVQYSAKLGDARYPNPSYLGRVCFISTPDGETCGLVKNLAVTCLVSVFSATKPIVNTFIQCGLISYDLISPSEFKDKTKVFLNGEWMGTCEEADAFVRQLRYMRRNQLLDPFVEIKKDGAQNEIRVFSDAGRLLRPLLVVENQRLCIDQLHYENFKKSEHPFRYLLEKGIIEIIGVEEEEDLQIACGIDILQKAHVNDSFPVFTHCELDPSFLLSLNASLIPFANRNLATRTLYQSDKHSRQAIGYYTSNLRSRCDTSGHQLFYPQKPLFRTLSSHCLSKPQLYNGQNAIVAVNVHYGYNQEDSLVANRASIDRGLFRTMHFRNFTSETDHDDNNLTASRFEVDFGKPQTGNLKTDKLEDDGLPYVASDLYSGDVIVGKVGPQPSDSNFSMKLKHTEKGRVDEVVLTTNDDGKKFAKVRLRQMRFPSLGDKFSSMHGQKGVLGFIEEQENMPFTREGIVPDLIINPHAFPSRQTPGQLFECALGKGIAASGVIGDATPFRPITVDYIINKLKRCGYEQWGKEQMYNGRTGSALQMKIFIGPTFYQRLIHMAEDKMKYRNHGPVHPLTRQPVHDRKRHGGVKFGEMERDCMLAHGATANLMERLFYLSDFSRMHICSRCQMVAPVILVGGARSPYCNFCKTSKHVVKVHIPYACKLLYQELFAMGICLKFQTELC